MIDQDWDKIILKFDDHDQTPNDNIPRKVITTIMHESEKVMKQEVYIYVVRNGHTTRNLQQMMTEHKLAVKCEIAINVIAAHTWDAKHRGRDVKVGGVNRMQEGLIQV